MKPSVYQINQLLCCSQSFESTHLIFYYCYFSSIVTTSYLKRQNVKYHVYQPGGYLPGPKFHDFFCHVSSSLILVVVFRGTVRLNCPPLARYQLVEMLLRVECRRETAPEFVGHVEVLRMIDQRPHSQSPGLW